MKAQRDCDVRLRNVLTATQDFHCPNRLDLGSKRGNGLPHYSGTALIDRHAFVENVYRVPQVTSRKE
jgi:hypothetical protein